MIPGDRGWDIAPFFCYFILGAIGGERRPFSGRVVSPGVFGGRGGGGEGVRHGNETYTVVRTDQPSVRFFVLSCLC